MSCALGDLPLAVGFSHDEGREVTVFCRPEQVRVATADGEGVDAGIDDVRFMGPDLLVDLTLAEPAATTLTARWPSATVPSPGDRLRVVVEGTVLAYPGTVDTEEAVATHLAGGGGGAR